MEEQKIKRNTQEAFYRRLLVAYLINTGENSFSALMSKTGWHRRTLQQVIKTLPDYGLVVTVEGNIKTRTYAINQWGAINKQWIGENLAHVNQILNIKST